MNQEKTTSESGRSRLNIEELIDLYKHFDGIHAGKENLFVPITLAIIPAILASWKDVTALVVGVAGAASVLLYSYHLFVTRRFSYIQAGLFGKIREFTSDIEEIVRYPRILGIARLRIYLLFIIILVWLLLWYCKYTGM